MLQRHVSVALTCLVRLNMGAGLVGQLCLAARREEGVRRPSTGSNRSKLNTGKPSYLMKNTHSHISERGHTVIYMHIKWVAIHQAGAYPRLEPIPAVTERSGVQAGQVCRLKNVENCWSLWIMMGAQFK